MAHGTEMMPPGRAAGLSAGFRRRVVVQGVTVSTHASRLPKDSEWQSIQLLCTPENHVMSRVAGCSTLFLKVYASLCKNHAFLAYFVKSLLDIKNYAIQISGAAVNFSGRLIRVMLHIAGRRKVAVISFFTSRQLC